MRALRIFTVMAALVMAAIAWSVDMEGDEYKEVVIEMMVGAT